VGDRFGIALPLERDFRTVDRVGAVGQQDEFEADLLGLVGGGGEEEAEEGGQQAQISIRSMGSNFDRIQNWRGFGNCRGEGSSRSLLCVPMATMRTKRPFDI
jgi:hypothetical protein